MPALWSPTADLVVSDIYTYEKKRTWHRPFVVPRDARLGVAAAIKIKMAPESKRQLIRKEIVDL